MKLVTGIAFVLPVLFAGVDGVVSVAQVKTDVPPEVAGAKAATVERITIRGASLEGNLEGNAVDREALVVGDMDNLKVDAGRLHDILTVHGIAHGFEVYSGTHTSKVAMRFQEHVMPFFSKALSFDQGGRR